MALTLTVYSSKRDHTNVIMACAAKQRKKKQTDLEKATNKKKLDSSRSEIRVNTGVTVQ